MGVDGFSIVGPDLDVDSDDPSMLHCFAETRIEDQGTTVCDPGLDDDVGLDPIDYLLHADHVVRQLDDGASHPRKAVDVFDDPADLEPCHRYGIECLCRVDGGGALSIVGNGLDESLGKIDRNLHA